jgi:hypothetical protein
MKKIILCLAILTCAQRSFSEFSYTIRNEIGSTLIILFTMRTGKIARFTMPLPTTVQQFILPSCASSLVATLTDGDESGRQITYFFAGCDNARLRIGTNYMMTAY